MLNEAIILCGGLGTRLKTVNPTLPKVLVAVAGKPFLHYVINYLRQQGIQHFVFATGYGHTDVEGYIKKYHTDLPVQFSTETTALGTGGAIKQALTKTINEDVLVANGDTFFKADIKKLAAFHNEQQSVCTIATTTIHHSSRYGLLQLNEQGKVMGFEEKNTESSGGNINAGMYLVNRDIFSGLPLPAAFSFEKDYLELYVHTQQIIAQVQDAYFIDIGIPADLDKAQKDFHTKI